MNQVSKAYQVFVEQGEDQAMLGKLKFVRQYVYSTEWKQSSLFVAEQCNPTIQNCPDHQRWSLGCIFINFENRQIQGLHSRFKFSLLSFYGTDVQPDDLCLLKLQKSHQNGSLTERVRKIYLSAISCKNKNVYGRNLMTF